MPLITIAYGRSGDKGDICNVGIAARHPDFVPVIAQELTVTKVKEYLAHLVKGNVERYELPGLHAFNFVLHEALGAYSHPCVLIRKAKRWHKWYSIAPFECQQNC